MALLLTFHWTRQVSWPGSGQVAVCVIFPRVGGGRYLDPQYSTAQRSGHFPQQGFAAGQQRGPAER